MKRLIASSRSNPYLNINSVFAEGEFSKDEFFNAVEDTLHSESIPVDDLKATISVDEDPDENEIDVKAKFSWIFYPEDVSKEDFAKIAKKIEKAFEEIYGEAFWFECDVTRYRDSEYASHGFDVEMKLRTQFVLN